MIQQDKKYVVVIDFLRGLAALMVVLVHVAGNGFLDNSFVNHIASYGQHGVVIFFVVSGFIIPWSLNRSKYNLSKFGNFINRRIIRLNPPYYAILLITIAFYYLSHDFVSDFFYLGNLKIDAYTIFLHLTYLIPFSGESWYYNVFWTLAIEFQYYLLIGLLYPFIHKNKYLTLLVLTLICFSHLLPFASNRLSILNWSTPFVLGITCFLYRTNFLDRRLMLIVLSVFVVLCQYQISGTRMLFALFACITILFMEFRFDFTDFLGKVSYSLYLTHILIFDILYALYSKLIDVKMAFAKEIFVIGFIPISILIAYLFYKLAEEPFMKLAKKIK
jgi:peptidoglycan/LPS O-acetylase OafA/YrhL